MLKMLNRYFLTFLILPSSLSFAGVWVEKPGCYSFSGKIFRYDNLHVFIKINEGSLSEAVIPIKIKRKSVRPPVGSLVEVAAWLRIKGPVEKSLAEAEDRRISVVTGERGEMFKWLGDQARVCR